MQVIESSRLCMVSGSGGRNDSTAQRNTSSNNNGYGKGGRNGNYYSTHTNPECVNGIWSGMMGGPAGVIYGAFKNGCFDSAHDGGGNIGMGNGGNKGDVGNYAGKNGSGGCTW